nr:hypothetical protein BaRGS_028759 [Batillaria attramentaria]
MELDFGSEANSYIEDAKDIPVPKFLPTNANFFHHVGETAVLECAVENLNRKKVVWRKASETIPLTVGLVPFVEDPRMEVEHPPGSSQWNLVIRNLRPEDAGVYECQVSSKVRHLRHHVTLLVKDIQISGQNYVDEGERIFLQCNATAEDQPPEDLDWFREGNRLQTSETKGVFIRKYVTLSTGTIVSILEIKHARLKDAGENRDVTKVKKRQLRKTAAKYTIREDVLYHDGILVAKRNQVPEILQEFHDNYVSGGHLGMNKTYKKVLERYFWHGMKQEVEDYCRSCCVCQNMNACRKKPAAPLHPIPVPKKKWSLVGMDIIGPLQVTDRGNQYIVALTDHFTKFPVAKAIPCKSSEEVARFMYETICIFGAFDSLITDQGREFINFALDILTDRFNINHRISSAYHPETNGQRERDNRTLKDTLVKITDNDDWDELLPAALFAYRTSVHKSTQFSPFLALYGEQAKLPFDVTGDANEQDLNEEIMDTMKGIHEEVKNKIGENISRAQKKQKEYYDSRRAYDHGFRIGDKVLIINAARVHRMGGKMAPRFVGPYEADNLGG